MSQYSFKSILFMLFIKKHTFFQYWFTSRKGLYLTTQKNFTPKWAAKAPKEYARHSISKSWNARVSDKPDLSGGTLAAFVNSSLRDRAGSMLREGITRLGLNSIQPKPWYCYWLLPFVGFVMASPYGTPGILINTTKDKLFCPIRQAQLRREGRSPINSHRGCSQEFLFLPEGRKRKFPLPPKGISFPPFEKGIPGPNGGGTRGKQFKSALTINIALSTHFGPRKIQILSLASLNTPFSRVPSAHRKEMTAYASFSEGIGEIPLVTSQRRIYNVFSSFNLQALRPQESTLLLYKTSKISFEQLYKKLLYINNSIIESSSVGLFTESPVARLPLRRSFGAEGTLLRSIIEKVIPKLGQTKQEVKTLNIQEIDRIIGALQGEISAQLRSPRGNKKHSHNSPLQKWLRSSSDRSFDDKRLVAANYRIGNKNTNTRFIPAFNESLFYHHYLGKADKKKQAKLFNIRLNGPFLSSHRPFYGLSVRSLSRAMPSHQPLTGGLRLSDALPPEGARVSQQGYRHKGPSNTLSPRPRISPALFASGSMLHISVAENQKKLPERFDFLPTKRVVKESGSTVHSAFDLSTAVNSQKYKPLPLKHAYTPLSEEMLLQAKLTHAFSRGPYAKGATPANLDKAYYRNSILAHLKKEIATTIAKKKKELDTRTDYPKTSSEMNPIDILRLKHFRLLRSLEKYQLNATLHKRQNTEFLFKENDLLHENFLQKTQKQKRRKKKIKRWTRRRRKRKRKLLRPLWITRFLAQKYTIAISSQTPESFNISTGPSPQKRTRKSKGREPYSLSIRNRKRYRFSKKALYAPKADPARRDSLGVAPSHMIVQSIYDKARPLGIYFTAQAQRKMSLDVDSYLRSSLISGYIASPIRVSSPRTPRSPAFRRRVFPGPAVRAPCPRRGPHPPKGGAGQEFPSRRFSLLEGKYSALAFGDKGQWDQQNNKKERYKKRNFINTLEYDRILAEKLQKNLRSTKIYTSPEEPEIGRRGKARVSKSTGIILGQRTKILHNEPKEEWVWLYKYISGELPSEPYLSEIDELRSIWALNKLQSTNQWTEWKNFYYQDFKKGVTARYETWLDKKPDKRYNVNNLKKRKYKYIKNIERLRISAKLRRGTYFALCREANKLGILGTQLSRSPAFTRRVPPKGISFPPKVQPSGKGIPGPAGRAPKGHSVPERVFSNETFGENFTPTAKHQHSNEAIRKTFKNIRKTTFSGVMRDAASLSTPQRISERPYRTRVNRIMHRTLLTKVFEKWEESNGISKYNDSMPISHAIVDQYSTWWNSVTNSSWGWKNIRYGAPWDRKTLYIPTRLITTNKTLSKTRGISTVFRFSANGFSDEGKVSSKQVLPYSKFSLLHNGILLSMTVFFHICIFLTLVSIPELRYTVKINSIFIYKLTTVPIKLVSSVVEPFYKSLDSFQSFVIYLLGHRRRVLESPYGPLKSPTEAPRRVFRRFVDLQINRTLPKPRIDYQSTLSGGHTMPFEGNTLFIGIPICVYNTYLQILKKNRRRSIFYKATGAAEMHPQGVRETDFPSVPKGISFPPEGALMAWTPSDQYGVNFHKVQAQVEVLLLKNLIALPLLGYKSLLLGREHIIDLFRDFILAIYDFFSLPENFSPNPDEMGLDILANFVYDFEEPFIELFPDIVDIQSEKYIKQFILPLSIFGPPGFLIQQRLSMFYRLFVELFYNPDAENEKDEQESKILYTVWADLINKAADEFDMLAIGISSQEELRVLILEHLLTSNFARDDLSESAPVGKRRRGPLPPKSISFSPEETEGPGIPGPTSGRDEPRLSQLGTTTKQKFNRSSLFAESSMRQEVAPKSHNGDFLVDQYILHKTDETDLFFELNPPKSFSHLRSMKYYDMIQQPFGILLCQIYSGLYRKQKAKNILLIGAKNSEKSLLIQSFAGETEMKLILDNSSRYATISQNVALGMRRLREVFEAISLQTPCIFLLEDIHLIGEKRPFLLSDEDLALVRNTNLGFEQHQPFEKNQNIQLYNRHRISNFKKPYRGDNPERLPTNMLCFDLFFHSIPKTKSIFPQAPIRLRSEGSYHLEIKNQDSSPERSRRHGHNVSAQLKDSLRAWDSRRATHCANGNPAILSYIDRKGKGPAQNLSIQNANTFKSNQLIPEKSFSLPCGLEIQKEGLQSQKNKTIQSKVSKLAEISLTNLSVKLDRITQFLVIMDNVRMNKGFIVFATTDKPQILDPALRRPGRLEETICLPTIPNILRKWENIQTQVLSFVKKTTYVERTLQGLLWQKNYCLDLTEKSVLSLPLRITTRGSCRTGLERVREDPRMEPQLTTALRRKNQVTELMATNYISVCKYLITFLYEPSHFNNRLLGLAAVNPVCPILKGGSAAKALREQLASSNLNMNNHSILFGTKKAFKLELMTLFASCVAKFFNSKKRILVNKLGSNKFSAQQRIGVTSVPHGPGESSHSSESASKAKARNFISKNSFPSLKGEKGNSPSGQGPGLEISFGIENISRQFCKGDDRFACKTKSLDIVNDPKWTFASQLIYAFIQKRAIWNKNKYVHKFFNVEKGSLVYFPSAPITTLLLPAKRFENFLRAEHDFEYTTHSNLTTETNTLQEKIQFHTTQRVLKRLYCLSIKQYYKSNKIAEKLKSRFPREPRNIGESNYFSSQSSFATAGKTNHYYRNLFLKRHRNYLTNQWWNGHLTEYNIENTLMSEVDFRTCFIETQSDELNGGLRSLSAKTKTTGDFFIDFPDADQYYNPIQQRWFSMNLQSTKTTQGLSPYYWKTWFDLEKGVSSDIINHFILETFSRTYNIFDQNRELLDLFVVKLSRKTKMQEIECLDTIRSILSAVDRVASY